MEKILRLSRKNLKRNKWEALILSFLIMLCMMLLSSSVSSGFGIKNINDDVIKNTNCHDAYMLVFNKSLKTSMLDFFQKQDNVTSFSEINLLHDSGCRVRLKNRRELTFPAVFANMENEKKFEDSETETSLTKSEIEKIEHPVWLPFIFQDLYGFKENDTFELELRSGKISFTVIGFYETVIFCNMSMGAKLIVSDSDFAELKEIMNDYNIIAFDSDDKEKISIISEEFESKFKTNQMTGGEELVKCLTPEDSLQMNSLIVDAFRGVLKYLAILIILSVVVMIRFKIKTDIEKQIESIGVLEALGYRFREILFSYVLEYQIITVVGIIFGAGFSVLLTSLMLKAIQIYSGHHGTSKTLILPLVVCGGCIFLLIGLISAFSASMIRKYPPVIAMRKGIKDHLFRSNAFPLKNTKKSVNLRIALKNCRESAIKNIGVGLCVLISTYAFNICVNDFVSIIGKKNFYRMNAGMELSDVHIELNENADAEKIKEELEKTDGIRKILCISSFDSVVSADYNNSYIIMYALKDYNEAENILPVKGRFPKYDNEIMLTSTSAGSYGIDIGDSIGMNFGNTRKKYIVSGLVTSVVNGGLNCYFTDEGIKRLNPDYKPTALEIYLDEGADAAGIKKEIIQKYGRNISDEKNGSGKKAETGKEETNQEASLTAEFDETNQIASVDDIEAIITTQTSAVMIGAAIIDAIMLVLTIIVETTVLILLMRSCTRRMYKDFGIMKSLGYTSKQLMLQQSMGVMPMVIISVASGYFASFIILSGQTEKLFGKSLFCAGEVLLSDLIMIVFSFLCLYLGSGKIKKIAVSGLVSE